jgi:hypothetical protein
MAQIGMDPVTQDDRLIIILGIVGPVGQRARARDREVPDEGDCGDGRGGGNGQAVTDIQVIVTGPEEAYDNVAEFWCANELMAVTVLHNERLHLRIESRADGSPWLADAQSLARALAEAEKLLATY